MRSQSTCHDKLHHFQHILNTFKTRIISVATKVASREKLIFFLEKRNKTSHKCKKINGNKKKVSKENKESKVRRKTSL